MSAPEVIHRFVPGSSARTLLLLHGTGGDENDLLPLGRELDPAAALLSPRGRVLENGMARFFRRHAEGVFDEADLRERAEELADFVGNAAARYERDRAQMVALGFSNGANIASAMLLLRPGTIAAAALLRAMVPFVPETFPDLAQAPVLIAAGRNDPLIAPAEAERLGALLERAGAAVSVRFDEGAHNLLPETFGALRRWYGGLPRSAA